MSYAKKRVEEGKIPRKKGFPYEGRPTYTVEWNEHPSIDAIDKYVVDQLSMDDQKSYFTYAYRRTNCMSDFKTTATLDSVVSMANSLLFTSFGNKGVS